jgi:hypothetical protein
MVVSFPGDPRCGKGLALLPPVPPVPIPIEYEPVTTGICFPTLTEEPRFQGYAWGIEAGVVVEVSIEDTNPPAPPPPPR